MEEKKEEKINRRELAQEGLKALQKIEAELQVQHLVKDNKIEFKVKDKIYRLRKPNQIESQEADNFRRRKYTELVTDDSYLFKKEWIKKYKNKGIDIPKKENRIREIQYELKKEMLRLAKTANPKDVDNLVKSIENLRAEQRDITIDVTDLLSYCIENQLTYTVNSYVTFLVLEQKVKDEWERAFKTYEDFQKSDNNELIARAYEYINYLIYGATNESEDTEKNS